MQGIHHAKNNFDALIQFTAPDTEVCVSWSFILQDWTTEGCRTDIGEDGIVTCSCNHLTNFAILVVSLKWIIPPV